MTSQDPTSSPHSSELHLHLYGCIDPTAMWQRLTNDFAKINAPALDLATRNYETLFGVRIDWESLRKKEDGVSRLADLFLVKEPCRFDEFQCKFDLAIALFPFHPTDRDVLQSCLSYMKKNEMIYAEPRTFLPPHLSDEDTDQFLKNLSSFAQEHDDDQFKIRYVLTLLREPKIAEQTLTKLCAWLSQNPQRAPYFVGIDFCMFEESDPIEQKQNTIRQLKAYNKQHPEQQLLLLPHVGETFETIPLECSIRRVLEWLDLGANRLGHACTLGRTPLVDDYKNGRGNVEEWNRHKEWLKLNEQRLSSFGLDFQSLNRNLWSDNDDWLAALVQFQNFALEVTKSSKVPIEVCPTSNLRLTGIKSMQEHPVHNFRKRGIEVILSSDDPGIFDTDLKREIELAKP